MNYSKNMKRVILFKWKNYANIRKLNYSSKIIQNFMNEIKKKIK